MKHLVVLAVCLVPAAAFAQQTYTNADLAKFQVPGAYTNQDLKRLPPLAVQKAPAAQLPRIEPAPVPTAEYQQYYDGIKADRNALAVELDYEKGLVDFSESAFAGDTRSYNVRLGYRAQARPLIIELQKRVDLLDKRLDDAADQAREAGVTLDRR